MEDVFVFLIPITGIVAFFAFLAVLVWTRHRRRERDAYYRHELGKQLVEKGVPGEEISAVLRQESRDLWLNRREGLKLGGLLTLLAGVGFMLAFAWMDDEPIWMIGWIPVAIGLALVIYGLLLAPKPEGA